MKHHILSRVTFMVLALALVGNAPAFALANTQTTPTESDEDESCFALTLTSGSDTKTAGFTQTVQAGPVTALLPTSYSGGSLTNAIVTEPVVPPWINPATHANFVGSGAQWISTHTSWPGGVGNSEGGSTQNQWRLFQESFTLPPGAVVSSATLHFTGDNAVEVYQNGSTTPIATTNDVYGAVPAGLPQYFANVTTASFTPESGTTTLAFVVRNWGGDFTENPTGLLYKAVVAYCVPNTPPTPTTVKVTINKFIDGVQATALSAADASFPMQADWNAENLGAGSGDFALGTTGFNSPNPYEAVTADMTAGADYGTHEVVGVGTTVGASCAAGTPFALAGYATGTSLALAMVAPATTSPPTFTDLTNDAFVIVKNIRCTNTSGTSTLVVNKIAVGGDATFAFTGDNGLSPFSITTASGTGSTTRTNIPSGTYHLSETPLSGWTQTENTCATVLLGAGSTSTCTVTNTKNATTGTSTLSEIRGTKYGLSSRDYKNDWRDFYGHGNSSYNRGLSGWTIYLDTNNNAILDAGETSTTTNWRGDYRFVGLAPGTYHVREVQQTGWVQSSPLLGVHHIVLTAGKISKKNDFVNARAGSITGMKYNDRNANGEKDRREEGLAGWTIVLKKMGSTVATTTTGANGTYSFTNLAPGTYRVSEVMQTGWRQTDRPEAIVIRSGTISREDNFGNTQKRIVRDRYNNRDDE